MGDFEINSILCIPPLGPPPFFPPPQRLIRSSIPFVGGLATAIVPPTLLIGPLVGIVATYVIDNGGLEGVKRLPVFNKKR